MREESSYIRKSNAFEKEQNTFNFSPLGPKTTPCSLNLPIYTHTSFQNISQERKNKTTLASLLLGYLGRKQRGSSQTKLTSYIQQDLEILCSSVTSSSPYTSPTALPPSTIPPPQPIYLLVSFSAWARFSSAIYLKVVLSVAASQLFTEALLLCAFVSWLR